MNNMFKYKTSQGLKVIYVYKKNFKTSYCGIGTKFGGANLKFKYNNIDHTLKEGTAHFIEHQLFKLADGSDAVKEFSNLFTTNNAYTQADKTIYFIKTTSDIYEPLKLLIKMYFTSNFNELNVEKEKSIIKSEMDMYNDNPGYRILSKIQGLSFPNDDFSKPIIGTLDSIYSINCEDLKLAHEAFYTPKNSVLCIIGNEEPNDIFNEIEKYLLELNLKNNDVYKYPIINSQNVDTHTEVIEDVYQSEIYMSFRLDNINSKDPISCDKLLILFDSLFNVASPFYQYLYKNDLFVSDIDFEVHTFIDASYILLHAPTDTANELINEIKNKIRNISSLDIDEKITSINIRHLISESILEEDNIQRLGDKILSLELEDIEYELLKDKISNLDIKDILNYIDDIKSSKITHLIVKPNDKMA